ncbi:MULTISPECIES: MaoC family dehydratase [Streptomyces]|uniref:MaoC family dehydratase n=1 Tax=Streptomyces incanus TaxID=887453 RepID=A0ABW0XUL7_9ACTN|nr:MaoC family dehydratase [Streptomyces hirsutus]
MRHIDGLDGLRSLVGERIGESAWVTIDQAAINAFADLSYDHNWVHTDPERAASSPFGSTIAHGGHSLAIIGGLLQQIFRVDRTRLILAYGFEKVRFPEAVPSGSKLRLVVDLAELREPTADAVDAVWRCVVEGDGFARPACVADMLMRYYGEA